MNMIESCSGEYLGVEGCFRPEEDFMLARSWQLKRVLLARLLRRRCAWCARTTS